MQTIPGEILKQLQGQYPAQAGGSDSASRQTPTAPDTATGMAANAGSIANPDMEQLVARARAEGQAQPLGNDSIDNGSSCSAFGGGSSSFTRYKANNA